jgi:[acyl-carrier-protein] S-malonyltransferase
MVTELQVSGAFHSPLMGSASEELGKAIESTVFNMPNKPVYPNVHAQPVLDQNQLKQYLLQQLTSPVRWSQTIQNMNRSGIKNYCEIGPGKVLQGLVKRSITASDLVIQGIDTSHDIKLVQGI